MLQLNIDSNTIRPNDCTKHKIYIVELIAQQIEVNDAWIIIEC